MICSINAIGHIVEEGALTAYGESRVILIRSDGTGLEMQEERATEEEVRKKKEVVKPKIEEKIKERLPIFDIGLIDVDTAWKKDISNFAEDDDGDSLKFTLASGPKQMQLSPEGVYYIFTNVKRHWFIQGDNSSWRWKVQAC